MKRTDQIERSEFFREYVGDPDPFQDIRFDLHARQRPLRPPLELDCHFDCVCEACTFFVTIIEFRPTLQRRREDAADKGQLGRQKIIDGLRDRLDQSAS